MTRRFPRNTFQCRPALAIVLVTCFLLLAGCTSGANPKGYAKSDSARPASAEALLEAMIAAYRNAKSYSDQGRLQLRYLLRGNIHRDEWPLSVSYVAPNKIRVDAYQTVIACDGEKLRARMIDEAAGEFVGQFVSRPAPEKLTLATLYSDSELAGVLTGGLAGAPLQLELLMGNKPLSELLADSTARALLAPKTVGGRQCDGAELTTEAGKLVFWIDRQTRELRRLEFPTDIVRSRIPLPVNIEELQLIADFHDARLGGEVPASAFEMSAPAGALVLRYFVRPPRMLPSRLFGQRPSAFRFSPVDRQDPPVTQDSLAGKIAVLMWFLGDPASEVNMRQLAKVQAEFADNDEVKFFAIGIDPSRQQTDQIVRQARQWGVQFPVVIDTEAAGRDRFEVPGAPTLVVLGKDGTVQIFEAQVNPDLAEQLSAILGRLLKGDDLAAEILRRDEEDRRQYQQLLATAGGEGETTIVPLSGPEIPPASEPAQLRLTKKWQCTELKSPGNILVVTEAGRDSQIYVLDGMQSVAAIDHTGRVTAQTKLPIEENAAVTYLRHATSGEGPQRRSYFVGSAKLGRQLFLFDDAWRLGLSYPALDQKHDGVNDVQFVDLDGDGEVSLAVGFWGLVGVQAIDPRGQRLWSNRSVASVISLCPEWRESAGSGRLLVTSSTGLIVPIDDDGHDDREVQVGTRSIHTLSRGDFAPGAVGRYCGLSYNADGTVTVVALRDNLEEAWAYRLSSGTHTNQIQPITFGRLLGDRPGQWIVAGADGSVHIIAEDGNFADHFFSGEILTGIAMAKSSGQPLLLLATEKGVTAWGVDGPIKAASR